MRSFHYFNWSEDWGWYTFVCLPCMNIIYVLPHMTALNGNSHQHICIPVLWTMSVWLLSMPYSHHPMKAAAEISLPTGYSTRSWKQMKTGRHMMFEQQTMPQQLIPLMVFNQQHPTASEWLLLILAVLVRTLSLLIHALHCKVTPLHVYTSHFHYMHVLTQCSSTTTQWGSYTHNEFDYWCH